MARLFFDPFLQAIDGNGNPMAGAKLYFYITGTTTPKNTYSNPDLDPSHLNANPVVADADGRFGSVYLATDAEYKAVLKTSADVTVATRDPLSLLSPSVIAHQGALIIGNSSGADSELTIGAANTRLTSTGTTAEWRAPNYTKQVFTSGSGTYTTPANCTAIKVRMIAGGGGGGGTGGTTGPNGATGGTTSFNSVTCIGGGPGIGNATGSALTGPGGGAGGTGGTGTASLRIAGGQGGYLAVSGLLRGGGGNGVFGGGAPASYAAAAANGLAGKTNSGGGGGGSSSVGTTESASGGGAGEYAELHISAPSATYSYAVGAGAAGGIGTGTGAATGGAGGSGLIIVEEFYS